MPRPSLRTIREKKQALLANMVRLEEQISRLRAEAADYEAAERVWLNLGGDEDDKDLEELSDMLDKESQEKAKSQRKPPGLLPVSDMIIEAISDALRQGKPGLDPAGMLLYVQKKYWPDAKGPDVGSTAWRMWKTKRLIKPDNKSRVYSLPGAKRNAA